MKKQFGFTINMGIVSLVVIFSVLCLTIFSVLSLSTAIVEKNLSEKAAEAISDYYTANLVCTQKTNALKQTFKENASPEQLKSKLTELSMQSGANNDGLFIRFAEPIDNNRALSVVLFAADGQVSVMEWKTISTGQWQPDEGLDVWLG